MKSHHRTGFTLVEVLVAIAIVGILMSLVLVAIQQTREAARQTTCKNNLRQLAMAALGYEIAKNELPPGATRTSANKDNAWGNDLVKPSWRAYLLPYLEQETLADQIDFEKVPAMAMASNQNTVKVPIAAFLCPSDAGWQRSKGQFQPANYVASVGNEDEVLKVRLQMHPDGAFFIVVGEGLATSMSRIQALGGTSECMLFSECLIDTPDILEFDWTKKDDYNLCINSLGKSYDPLQADANITPIRRSSVWLDGRFLQLWGFSTLWPPNPPVDYECELTTTRGVFAARSRHPGIVNAAFADGSVRKIADDIEQVIWERLGSIANRQKNNE